MPCLCSSSVKSSLLLCKMFILILYTHVCDVLNTNGYFPPLPLPFISLPLPFQDSHSVVSHLRQQKDETLKEVRSVCQTLQDTIKKDQEQRTLAVEEHNPLSSFSIPPLSLPFFLSLLSLSLSTISSPSPPLSLYSNQSQI